MQKPTGVLMPVTWTPTHVRFPGQFVLERQTAYSPD
jgi:hypothetical protein